MALFKLAPASGQPLYAQLIEQIRHAIETGALRHGDSLPGIRTLAEELVVSPNTVAKAYSELEHGGFLDLRHGAGAFVIVSPRTRLLAGEIHSAQLKLRVVIQELREAGLHDDEIGRAFQTELRHSDSQVGKR